MLYFWNVFSTTRKCSLGYNLAGEEIPFFAMTPLSALWQCVPM